MNRIFRLSFFLYLPISYLIFSMILTSCSKNYTGPKTVKALGTVCTVNAYDDGNEQLYSEIAECLDRIENEFSASIENSDISRINAQAGKQAVTVSDDVIYVLKKSLYYAEFSGGEFDPTIGPLVKLWGINTDSERIPVQEEIQQALKKVDYKKVKIENNSVMLEEQDMSLDLGAIAKGFAADKVAQIMEQNKVKKAVIDLGGNIYVYGKKENNLPWKLGIRDPNAKEGNPALAVTFNESITIVTSGVYERFFMADGKRYHHILNTKTGYPAQSGILSATITDTSSIDADALSTISFILGPERFAKLYAENEELKNKGVIFIKENDEVIASQNLLQKLDAFNQKYKNISFSIK